MTVTNAPSTGTTDPFASAPVAESAAMQMSRSAVSRRLVQFGRPLMPVLATSTFFRIVQMLMGIALFGVGAWGVGEVATKGSDADVAGILWVMVGLAFAKGFTRYLEQFSGHFVAFKLLAMLRGYFYDELEPQAPAGVESRRTGDLLARVTKDIDRVEVFYAHTVAPAIAAVIVPTTVVIWLSVAYTPIIGLTLLPFLVGVGLITPFLSYKAATKVAKNLREERGELSQHLSDSVQGVREVLAFGHVDRRGEQLRALGVKAGRSMAAMGQHIAIRRGANELLVALGLVAILFVGRAQIEAGNLVWTELAVILAVSLLTFGPVLGVEEFIGDLEQAFAGARRIWDITDAAPVVSDPAQPIDAGTVQPWLRFENVTFSYKPGDAFVPAAVANASIEVPVGSRVAIVGSSGSGKSTLVSLLLRFWDPQGGRVLLGGYDLRSFSLEDLRARIAVVSQRTYLFNDTIKANLLLARPSATQGELEDACRRAALHDTIAAMPDGYDTVVGEMGERLSGGQRQRLAIARALLKDSPILVLDEATSNLDVHTEAEIQGQLETAAVGRTVVLVAHRLATVVSADLIVVMESGQIVEHGRHEELLAANGAYANLWNRQATDLDA